MVIQYYQCMFLFNGRYSFCIPSTPLKARVSGTGCTWAPRPLSMRCAVADGLGEIAKLERKDGKMLKSWET